MKNAKKPLFIAQQLAAFVAELSIDTLPLAVIEEARRCLLDTTAVIVAGQSAEVVLSTRAHAISVYAGGWAHVLASGDRLHPIGAALVNATAGHANDFDDTSYSGIMHGSVVVYPAVLALAEERGINGARLLEAFVAGVEVEYAIAELCSNHIYFKGWWTTGVYGGFGAAAACAKILQLDLGGIANAISIAASYASGMRACFGSDAKPLGVGMAAAKGLEAALFAACGLTGPVDVFESESGFLKLLNDNEHSPEFDLQLSKKWRLVDPGILFKSYPVCSAAQAAAELSARLIEQHGLNADDIERVVCEVPPLVELSLIYNQPNSSREAQFSMPFAVGCMLAFGDLGLEHLTMEVLMNPQLQRQMQKVTMRVPDTLASDPTVMQRCPEGAGVTLITQKPDEFKGFMERPTGMPGNPVSTQVLVEKFRACLLHGGKNSALAYSIADEFLEIEKCPNVRLICEKLSA